MRPRAVTSRRTRSCLALLALALVQAAAWLAYAQSESLHVGQLTLVSSVRHSRTEFDYTYRIQLVSSGGARRNVAAYVSSASPGVTVLDNEVLVGEIAAGATITPADTFVVRHNRSSPFNVSALRWNIESEPANGSPAANAGPDQTVRAGDDVTLDGSGSTDPDSNPLTYRWQLRARPAGSSAALNDTAAVRPRFTVDRAGTYLIDLIVNDGHVDSLADTVQISTINSSPIANAGPDRTVPRASLVTLDGSGSSDSDGDTLHFEWVLTQRPAGSVAELTNAQTQAPSFQIDRPGMYVARLIVNDGGLASDPDEVRISTENSIPVAHAGNNLTAFVGDAVTLDGSSSLDADSDALSFLWTFTSRPVESSAALTAANTPNATLTPDFPGLYVVQLIVNDGFADSAPDTATVTVEVRLPPSDRDGDGLTDAREAELGTDPDDADSDDDTLSDGAEVDTHQTNPNAADTDGDGFRDDEEIRAGSDPRAPGSTPGSALPRDPASVAPPNPIGEIPIVYGSTQFLYTGPNAIQTGVAPGTIVPKRAAVVRGRVLDRANAPLAGVAITIRNHPELGRTLSREDGRFDLAVNGGGPLTIDYEHRDHLPAQRQIDVPWQDYVLAPDVVLVSLDPEVTKISTNAAAMQIARGSVSSDEDGTRRSTLLFPAGTAAAMVLPDGTTQALSSLHVRATEYTVGANGPNAMPGDLPPTSGYTYAVELSADEALAAGAREVRFSQPVTHYVENFVGFPVGTIVPSGYYDRSKAAWIPSENGRVVRIAAIANGLATVDTVGPGTLPAIALSEDERRQLAQLYAVGQELWRVPIAHFTPWDHNFPFGLPGDARAPRLPIVSASATVEESDCEEDGSIIQCLSQILRETLPITGSSYQLRYSSAGMPGRTVPYVLDIPLSTSEALPASLRRIVVDISVAGNSYTQTYSPAPNLTHRFVWDGKDAYGRNVPVALANVSVGYVYPAVFQSPEDIARNFARLSGLRLLADLWRTEVTIRQSFERALSRSVEPPVGGWSLSPHHAYDPVAQVIYEGGIARRMAPAVVTTIAPGSARPDIDEGGDVSQANLQGLSTMTAGPDGSLYISTARGIRRIDPEGVITTIAGGAGSGMAVGPDGSLYVADAIHHRVRRVRPDGIIVTFAGNGTAAFTGDGGPANEASLNQPRTVAVTPDGSVYIADSGNRRIRHVDPQGVITTIAGTGQSSNAGDGGRAALAAFRAIQDMAVGRDGSVYVVDVLEGGNRNIRRITTSGVINNFAGTRFPNGLGDGGLATQADLGFNHYGLTIGADGSVYIVDGNTRMRRITPNGVITTFAGGGNLRDDGGLALRLTTAGFYPVILPDGSFRTFDHVLDSTSTQVARIRKISSALPQPTFEEILIPSKNGSELYVFSAAGRHLRTLDALTRAMHLTFGYDTEGRLISMTDGDGNITRLERDDEGRPTAIVAPGGQRTTLETDSNGYLARVTNPAGEAVQLSYVQGGLLATKTDAKDQVHRFSYDPNGRLIRDEDPAGGVTTLTRVDLPNGYEVTRSTALGRIATYRIEELPSGEIRRVNSDDSGARTTVSTAPDGTVSATSPNGTVTTTTPGPDPRFGMLVPIPTTITQRVPSGRTLTQTMQRSITRSDPNDPLSVQVLLDTVSVNGRAFTERYDATSRTRQIRTPAGREATITLDAQGRTLRKDPAPGQNPITYDYDERGRLRQVVQGDLSRTYAYDSAHRVESRTNAEGEQTLYGYDAADRVERITTSGGVAFRFEYDANGNRQEIELPGGAIHRFTYTPIDKRATHALPGTGMYERVYDVDRARRIFRLPGGRAVESTFDASGRDTGFLYPEASVTVDYRAGDATSRPERVTRTPTAIGAAQQLQFTYDGGLPISTTWSGVAQGVYTYSYDNDFLPSVIRLVSGTDDVQTSIVRDADGWITGYGPFTLTRNGPAGAISAISDGVSASTFVHDAMGRIESRALTVNGTPAYATQLTRDRAGRIAAKTETLAGGIQTYRYAYDDDGRLTEVTRDGVIVEQYGYDANDNRISRQLAGNPAESASYDAQDRLLQQGDVTYVFDADGFLSRRGGDTFVYSARGELLQATVGGQVATYSYDGAGRRIGRTTSSGTIQYFYGDPGNAFLLTAVRDVNGVLTTLYYDDDGLLFALQRGSTRFQVAVNQAGTPRRVIDASGQVVKALDLDAFGGVISDSNPGFDLAIGFAGGLADSHSGLVRFGFRDYDPASGRWTARDPAGFGAGQANLFAYVGNDPINRRDPLGLAWCIGASAFFIVGGGAQVCYDDGDMSVCGELGFGIGAGGELGEGELSDSGVDLQAQLSAECGPVGGTLGVTLDDDGCVDLEAGVQLGPLSLNNKGNVAATRSGGDEVKVTPKCAAQAKAVGKVCGKF